MTQRATVTALLAVLSLVLHLTLARQFERVHTFEQLNVLFQADISSRLLAISGGNHLGIKHPNLMPYFTPPIALVAKVLVTLNLASGPEAELRRRLGTVVVPAASALKTALVVSLFHELGFSWAGVTVATLLEMMSFSTLIFGSIPESFGLTALALAMAYAFAAGSRSGLTWRRTTLWVTIGVFATGITLTNIALVALLVWAAAWEADAPVVATTVRVAAIVIAIFGVTGVSAYVLDRVLVPPEPSAVAGIAGAAAQRLAAPLRREFRYFAPSPVRRLGRLPTSVANAFAPPTAESVAITSIVGGRHKRGFTLESSPNIFGLDDPLGLSMFLLLVAGAYCSLATPASRPIATASVGILAFGGLFNVWGSEAQLYSQHWHLAAVVLIAGVMRAPGYGRLMTLVLGVLTLVVAVNNFMLLRAMLTALATVPP